MSPLFYNSVIGVDTRKQWSIFYVLFDNHLTRQLNWGFILTVMGLSVFWGGHIGYWLCVRGLIDLFDNN